MLSLVACSICPRSLEKDSFKVSAESGMCVLYLLSIVRYAVENLRKIDSYVLFSSWPGDLVT